jgi:hypothetical protein
MPVRLSESGFLAGAAAAGGAADFAGLSAEVAGLLPGPGAASAPAELEISAAISTVAEDCRSRARARVVTTNLTSQSAAEVFLAQSASLEAYTQASYPYKPRTIPYKPRTIPYKPRTI